jgi:hypothetical protein
MNSQMLIREPRSGVSVERRHLLQISQRRSAETTPNDH